MTAQDTSIAALESWDGERQKDLVAWALIVYGPATDWEAADRTGMDKDQVDKARSKLSEFRGHPGCPGCGCATPGIRQDGGPAVVRDSGKRGVSPKGREAIIWEMVPGYDWDAWLREKGFVE
jgi:hypothetical protein